MIQYLANSVRIFGSIRKNTFVIITNVTRQLDIAYQQASEKETYEFLFPKSTFEQGVYEVRFYGDGYIQCLQPEGSWEQFVTPNVSIAPDVTEDNVVSEIAITQNNSFVRGQLIRYNVITQKYELADCLDADNAEVVGIITEATSTSFKVTTMGIVPIPIAFINTKPGDVLFLSETPGEMTETEPSTLGMVSKPVAIILKTGEFMSFVNMRGILLEEDI